MGPTTAGRMDPYVDLFQSHGGSMIMLAKGNRSQQVTDACKAHGGFYLGSIGGPAAILAQNNIKSIECVEYPELGMEAIWKIEVEDFPAFILVDNKGNDFFKQLPPPAPSAKPAPRHAPCDACRKRHSPAVRQTGGDFFAHRHALCREKTERWEAAPHLREKNPEISTRTAQLLGRNGQLFEESAPCVRTSSMARKIDSPSTSRPMTNRRN